MEDALLVVILLGGKIYRTVGLGATESSSTVVRVGAL